MAHLGTNYIISDFQDLLDMKKLNQHQFHMSHKGEFRGKLIFEIEFRTKMSFSPINTALSYIAQNFSAKI